ncbi:transcriptional corepressor LEUNIG [Tanacetum coccineum]
MLSSRVSFSEEKKGKEGEQKHICVLEFYFNKKGKEREGKFEVKIVWFMVHSKVNLKESLVGLWIEVSDLGLLLLSEECLVRVSLDRYKTDGLSGFPTAKRPRIQTNSRGVSGSAQLSAGNTKTSSPIQHLTNDPQSSLVKQQSRASITNIAQGDARSVLDDTDRLYKSVLLWDVPTRNPLPTTLEQPHYITDIRFQPNSTFFAAACFDKIYYCDSTNVSKAPVILKGHTGPVKSIDFSPKDPHILCSCDNQGEILIWDLNTCRVIFKLKENGVSSNQVWFQSGSLLAVASGKKIILLLIQMDSEKIRITSKVGTWPSLGGVREVPLYRATA